jgi:hypothetical protein
MFPFFYPPFWQTRFRITQNTEDVPNLIEHLQVPFPRLACGEDNLHREQWLVLTHRSREIAEAQGCINLRSERAELGAEKDLYTDPDNLAAHLITARPLHPDVHSAEAYSQTRQWLNSCQSHGECPRPTTAALPTRVIEMMPVDHPETPRLLNTVGTKGQYLCLIAGDCDRNIS